MELFPEYENSQKTGRPPLADRMRPLNWDEFLGQDHLIAMGKPLRRLLEINSRLSFILWGPPGSGKTTIARIAANLTRSNFQQISAVNAGVGDIRKIIHNAETLWRSARQPTILFIDEIHRFNKAQQDSVLPYVENGTIRLMGATTENPSHEVIPALRSRCQIFRLEALSRKGIRELLQRSLLDKHRGLGGDPFPIEESAIELIVRYANGDARRALNVLEAAYEYARADEEKPAPVNGEVIQGIIQRAEVLFEKNGTEHYDHASAFQKSLRGSDPDAAVYWLAKMLAGGEDPRFIARRLVVTAAEDVGLADPQALAIANAAAEAAERLGMPEARIPLAAAVIYVARAPKDNSAIVAIDRALDDIQKKGNSFPVPDHLKDTHYKDAKARYGYGSDYKYPHDYPDNFVEQEYLPPELRGTKYVPQTSKNQTEPNLKKTGKNRKTKKQEGAE